LSELALEPAFIGPEGERLFCLLRRPAGPARGCVLIVPAFAEEMNKSRRMIALTAHALAQRGIASVMPDLFGTGDSDGSFADASWERWRADVIRARDWCAQQGLRVTGMLANRLGCALGVAAMRDCAAALETTVFWQPVLDGARTIDQFLRLRVAATLMSADARESVKDLRTRLRSGSVVEVAGYPLGGVLAASIDEVKLDMSGFAAGRLHWMEVVRSADAELPAPSVRAMNEWRAAGQQVVCESLVGEPYWTSTEIVTLPELVQRTAAAFGEAA
jgi:exosortase A-associated hydrolase 2